MGIKPPTGDFCEEWNEITPHMVKYQFKMPLEKKYFCLLL